MAFVLFKGIKSIHRKYRHTIFMLKKMQVKMLRRYYMRAIKINGLGFLCVFISEIGLLMI